MSKSTTTAAKSPKSRTPRKSPKPKTVVRITAHANGAAFSEKRPGVLAVMTSMLNAASATKPVSKKTILEALTKQFPDRDAAQMASTLSMQIPSGIRYEKGIELVSVDVEGGKGYYVDQKATAALQSKRQKERDAKKAARAAAAK